MNTKEQALLEQRAEFVRELEGVENSCGPEWRCRRCYSNEEWRKQRDALITKHKEV